MKTTQILIGKNESPATKLNELIAIGPQLVMIFAPADEFEKNDRIGAITKALQGKAMVIGCSTAGEISNKGVDDGTIVVTGAHFKDPQMRAVSASIKNMDDSYRAGRQLVEELDKEGLTTLFILGRGLEINGSALVTGIRDVIGDKVVVTGGLAGDGGAFKRTFTILNDEIASDRIVGVAFYGGSVKVAYGSMGGWEPFGPARRITKSKQNVLFELDGEPALDLYKKYLGDAAKDLPGSGLLYPFAILNDREASTGLIRTILAVDEKERSLTLAGDVPEGGMVRLTHSNKKRLTTAAQDAATLTAKMIHSGKDEGLGILVSCVGRKLVMGSDVEDELDAVRDVFGKSATVTGFYSYGEICPQEGFTECKLHNQTMTITFFYE